jgi:hypothetical protein
MSNSLPAFPANKIDPIPPFIPNPDSKLFINGTSFQSATGIFVKKISGG